MAGMPASGVAAPPSGPGADTGGTESPQKTIAALNGVPVSSAGSEKQLDKSVVTFSNRPMAIDADGSGDAWKHDPTGQPTTSLQIHGQSLNPTVTPYIVIPNGFPNGKLGDYVAVSYNGKTTFAIIGDVGPRLGEGSIALARSLGIPPSPTSGGVPNGVAYTIIQDSRDKEPPQDPDVIQQRGQEILQQKGMALGPGAQ